MRRGGLFIVICGVGFVGPMFVFWPLVAVYVAIFNGIELIILAACIDVYFATQALTWPLYTTLITGLVLLGVLIKPYLLLYKGRN